MSKTTMTMIDQKDLGQKRRSGQHVPSVSAGDANIQS